jgi:hypothetical protein
MRAIQRPTHSCLPAPLNRRKLHRSVNIMSNLCLLPTLLQTRCMLLRLIPNSNKRSIKLINIRVGIVEKDTQFPFLYQI